MLQVGCMEGWVAVRMTGCADWRFGVSSYCTYCVFGAFIGKCVILIWYSESWLRTLWLPLFDSR